jgi:methionine synthase II (cobalamin-independent)
MAAVAPLTATGIGSVPFTDPEAAAALVLSQLPEAPFWPQLVRLGFQEDMVAQGARGLPALRLDEVSRTVRVDSAQPRELALADFYEAIWLDDLSPFAMAPEEAQGFFALLHQTAAAVNSPPVLKGQVVGPVTFAGMVKDDQGKAILYDRELTQAVSLGLARKAAWQAQQFRELGKEAVIFFDEPILTGFGSAFFPISREEVATILLDTLEAVRQPGPVTVGVHCCGNTDWSLLLNLPIDILSFDSYGYFDSLLLYEAQLKTFLSLGGWLAWGLVPTGDELARENEDSLWRRFQHQIQQAADRGFERRRLLSQAILTPACGLGYLSEKAATQALALLHTLRDRGRRWLADF